MIKVNTTLLYVIRSELNKHKYHDNSILMAYTLKLSI